MNSAVKLVGGALLIGAGIASANATILAVAGGVGVNWSSDAVTELWDRYAPVPVPGSPLQRAYERAIEKAVTALRAQYAATYGTPADPRVFELVAASAHALSSAAIPRTLNLDMAQHELETGLAELLYGHDERQVAFLQKSLLSAVAYALHAELVSDENAWRQFNGDLVQGLARRADNFATRQQVDLVLAQLADNATAARALQASAAQLQELFTALDERLQAASPGASVVFNNQDMNTDTVNQAGQNLYIRSAHAENGGAATVNNSD